MKNIFHFLLILFILLSFYPLLLSQNAPITTAATVGGAVPGTVSIPITVTGFTNIGAASLSIDYNYSVLHFVSGTPHPLLSSFPAGDQSLGNGYHRITMGWFGSGTTLADGSTIMTLNFTYIAGNTPLTWYDNGPSCEYADGNYNLLNDIPASTYYINGNVCGAIANPGTITGDDSVCLGEMGLIYSIDQIANATGYAWSVPAGASIANGGNTNSIMVDYSSSAVSGNVSVCGLNNCGNGPSSILTVTVNFLPVANAGNDVFIPYGTSTTLNAASGGSGSFSYHWSPEALLVNPNLQNPQTVNLYSTTVFKLLVTNLSTSCHDSDEVVVTITGGPLSINPAAIPNMICSGNVVQLYSNAGGGSGNYSYSWTSVPAGSPPWASTLENPAVTPTVSTQYLLSVFDGFNTVSESTNVTVYQLPAATLSGGDSLCDDGSSTTITIDLTGIPPWYFIWSDGLNSYIVPNQSTTPYLVVTSDPGTYTVLYVQDPNCTGLTYGSANVLVFPVPVTPVITLNSPALLSDACCGNQWYLDDQPVPGATGQVFYPAQSGAYYDIVTVNGCISDQSNTIDVIVSVEGKMIDQPWFYPNPAGSSVKLRYSAQGARVFTIQFFDVYGVKRKEFIIDATVQGNEKELDISDLLQGFYLVVVEKGKDRQFTKLIKE